MSHPLSTKEAAFCAVCKARALPLGFRPWDGLPLLWVCADRDCQSLIAKVYGMPQETLDAYERKAALAAGDAAGQWLDTIGKTDLAALTREEWEEFLGHVVLGYQATLRDLIKTDAAPF